MNIFEKIFLKPVEKLFSWTEHFANTKYKMHALFWVAFSESSFFIVPPDILIMAIAMYRRMKPMYLAIFTGIASTLGGILGYYIGAYFFDLFGNRLLDFYGAHSAFDSMGELFKQHAMLVIFLKTFIPIIPYKIFTIAAGVFKVNIWTFIIASFTGRTIRFYIVAFLSHKYGERAKDIIKSRLDILFYIVLAFIILGIYFLNK